MSDHRLEEKIAHLERALDELSMTVERQDREIALMTKRVQMLMEREAQREEEAGSGVVLGDAPPPHY
ncbi:MAG: SlyX family protein [Pseudomonadota bacterium]